MRLRMYKMLTGRFNDATDTLVFLDPIDIIEDVLAPFVDIGAGITAVARNSGANGFVSLTAGTTTLNEDAEPLDGV